MANFRQIILSDIERFFLALGVWGSIVIFAVIFSIITGSFQVVDSSTLDDIVGFHHRKEEISDMKFSPGMP